MTNPRIDTKPLPNGTIVARTEAPTALLRVNSWHITDKGLTAVRVLPYRRSGAEEILAKVGSVWVGGGSVWLTVEA
jgi:hypothetical protein